jgi:hypothetical protein
MLRIDVAVVYQDGRKEVVPVGRPAVLIAFEDHFGHDTPSGWRELCWLTHKALGVAEPLDVWVEQLEIISSRDEDVDELRAELNGGKAAADPQAAATGSGSPA